MDSDIDARLEQLTKTPAPEAAAPEVEEQAKPEAKTVEKPKETKESPAVNEPFPGYSKLSEEDRKAADKWLAQQKSVVGRVSRTQSENEQLRRETAALKAEMSKLSQSMTPKQQAELARWKKFQELAPEDAEAYEERLSPLVQEIAELKKRLEEMPKQYEDRFSRFEKRERVQEIEQKKSLVLAEHPDYSEIAPLVEELDEQGRPTGREIYDPEAPFTQWLEENPEFIPAMTSDDPKAHARTIKFYKLSNNIQTREPEPSDPRATAVARRQTTLRQTADPKPTGVYSKPAAKGNDAEIDARLDELVKPLLKR